MKTYKMADLLKKDQKALNEELTKLSQGLQTSLQKVRTNRSGEDVHSNAKFKKQTARVKTAIRQLSLDESTGKDKE